MKLTFDFKTKRHLVVILQNIPRTVKKIHAAIAYTKSDLLINTCINNKIQLDWWGLFDSKESTSYEIVKKAISSELVRFYPFAEYFHPKVIYFEGYGLYIGSANMTHSALYNNVEAGIFIEFKEMTEIHLKEVIEFFQFLRESCIPATEEDLEKINQFLESSIFDKEAINKYESQIEESFEDHLGHLFLLKPGVRDNSGDKENKIDKKKLIFLQEWRETQNYISNVKKVMIEKCIQPHWIDKKADPTIITDQLLHAYYYSFVLEGNEEGKSIEKVKRNYDKNKHDPSKATTDAIKWWEDLIEAPGDEDLHINKWGIINQNILGNLRNRDLTLEEFKTIIEQNHAARNHARQIKNEFFSLPTDFKTDFNGRIKIFSEWLYDQKSKVNRSINEVLRYLLFDESISLEDKIYNVIYDEKYKIERLGKSIVGEIVGWGRPDLTHLRNNRVNKALRCLGYDVKLFSE